jgi:hypothetical protein
MSLGGHRQRFFQPFLQAPVSAGIDPLQLPEDFLQRLFGLRVVVHRVGIAHPPIRNLSGSSRAGTPSHSVACESGNAALPLVPFSIISRSVTVLPFATP